ncbi:uncharacterized protein LOC143056850 [Mytilus galloprovincialis]|uniref:uncharacterized protein LOC143056850 n=1 Tax=Mytilus galloprovincialis TaxID=29158 RepID=UPI003F7B5F23
MTEDEEKDFHMKSSLKQKLQSFGRNCKIQDKMKTKNFYILVLFLGASTLSLWLLSNPSPHLHTIVTQTHIQINNIKNIPENIRTSHNEEYKIDPNVLEELGFHETHSISYNNLHKDIENLPIGTAIKPGLYDESMRLIKSCHKHLPSKMILIYDLGINYHQRLLVKMYCNETIRKCILKKFEYEQYPSHVKDLEIKSYRPIIIQEILRDYGMVLWAEPPEVLLTGQINHLIKKAQTLGLVAWTIKDPVSSLTYTKMLKHFKVKIEDYYFKESAKTSQLIVFDTEKIHKELMLPWVKCALVEECISPTGAQNTACNYERKPLFKYSGCHKYDMSAFDVILGKIFKHSQEYAVEERVFGVPKIVVPQNTENYQMYVSHNVTTDYIERTRLVQIP